MRGDTAFTSANSVTFATVCGSDIAADSGGKGFSSLFGKSRRSAAGPSSKTSWATPLNLALSCVKKASAFLAAWHNCLQTVVFALPFLRVNKVLLAALLTPSVLFFGMLTAGASPNSN